jgi:hypothetical protein
LLLRVRTPCPKVLLSPRSSWLLNGLQWLTRQTLAIRYCAFLTPISSLPSWDGAKPCSSPGSEKDDESGKSHLDCKTILMFESIRNNIKALITLKKTRRRFNRVAYSNCALNHGYPADQLLSRYLGIVVSVRQCVIAELKDGKVQMKWLFRTTTFRTIFYLQSFFHRTKRLLLFAASFALFHSSLVIVAQSNPSATKDPSAVSTINTALASMGGQPAFSAIQDATAIGQSQKSTNGGGSSGQITWKTVAMAVRCETATSSGTSIYTVSNGVGYLEDTSGNVSPMNQRLALSTFPYVMPGIVLSYLLSTPSESLSVIQDQGARSSMIHIQAIMQLSDPSLASATKQDWYIDLNTGLPSRVDYSLVDPAALSPDGTTTVLFNSWQKTSTILAPQTIQILQNGTAQSAVMLGAPVFNQGLQQGMFTLP